MSVITIYEIMGDAWKSNIGPSINSVPSTAFVGKVDSATGNLVVTNQADAEMAGGLISDNVPIPSGTKYFGLDVIFTISEEDRPHFARGENDLKITFPGGAQANGSTQWNDDKKIWQLGANDGSGWVDSGYNKAPVVGQNKWQIRMFFDGVKWSFTGLRLNDDVPFVPGSNFQNLPAAATNWSSGLHPQLQTEARKAPWFLREVFQRVRILASDQPVPWTFD